MICDESLKQFIQEMADADDAFETIGKVFAPIGKKYHICELKVIFVAPAIYCSSEEKSREVVLYAEQAEKALTAFCEEYKTKERGRVIFELYREANSEPFTEQEKTDLKTVLSVIYMHCTKWKAINMVKDIGNIDSLTGLPNSGGLVNYADELLKKKELQKYNAFYFNLARFGLINKRYGVKETDRIITRYATTLSAFLDEGERLGRLGGDNFVALIKKERTETFLDIISGVKTYGVLDGKEDPFSISAVAGILEIDENIDDCANNFNDCAMALNIAKHVKRVPYAYASVELKEQVMRKNQIIAAFPKAIQNREFKAFYQPKVCIQDYSIVGAEALVRWEQDGKFVSPGEFIPAFEQNGMVCELDFYILEQVCMDIRKWIEMGLEPARISVNFSRKHLSNPNLAEDIMRIINKYEVDSKYIEIELTETVDEEEAGLLIEFMNKMRKYHIFMTIDDFGTGYSSLNMLRSFPVDVLKIDKSLVDNMEESDHIILSNVVKMASELKMDVVAEGVETWEQVEYLKTVQCSVVQGFLFDRPMPREQFEERIAMGKYDVK